MATTRVAWTTDPRGEHLVRQAVPRAGRLVRAVRDADLATIGRTTDTLDRQELVGLAVVLAALAAGPGWDEPDGELQITRRLDWVAKRPEDWSHRTLLDEAARYDHGARDLTAKLAHRELGRRYLATLRATRRTA